MIFTAIDENHKATYDFFLSVNCLQGDLALFHLIVKKNISSATIPSF
jgi:hypothetical protein